MYRWVLVTEEVAVEMENRDKNPLKKGLGKACEINGKAMRQYHVDTHPDLFEYISEKKNRNLVVIFLSTFHKAGVL